MTAKTWREKLAASKPPKTVLLEKDFAGVKAGNWLFIGSPELVADYISSIPFGETRNIVRLRNEIARQNDCTAMCPVSTSIFIRIAAEAAIEEMNDGRPASEVTPFWRVLDSSDKITSKLNIDSQWLDVQRESEQTG